MVSRLARWSLAADSPSAGLRPSSARGAKSVAAEAAAAVALQQGSERLTREDRLRSRRDYVRCYERGRRIHGRWATLFVCRNEVRRPRLGVTASRRVGNSVVRHLLRRRVKEIFRRSRYRRDIPAVDVVVHLKTGAAEATFGELQQALDQQLRRLARRGSRS